MELSDSAKTIKNIQTFKNSQEVIKDQAQKIKVKLGMQSVCQIQLYRFTLKKYKWSQLFSFLNSFYLQDLTSQAIILGKEARCQEIEQEQLHLGIQELEQENRQLLARVEQEKKRTKEVEIMLEILEEKMKELERDRELGLGWDQERQHKNWMIELQNKVRILIYMFLYATQVY